MIWGLLYALGVTCFVTTAVLTVVALSHEPNCECPRCTRKEKR